MGKAIDFLGNVYKGLTISGLDPYEIPNCESSHFCAYFEMFTDSGLLHLKKHIDSNDEINRLISEAGKYPDIGDLPEDEQKLWLAAFNMVLVDRFAIQAKSDADPWVTCSLFHALHECYVCLDSQPWTLANKARVAAKARHKGSPKQLAKDEIKALWERYHYGYDQYKSAAAFAREMLQRHPVIESEKTIDKWVRAWRAIAKPEGKSIG